MFLQAACVLARVSSLQQSPGHTSSPRKRKDSTTPSLDPSKVTLFSGLPSIGLQTLLHLFHLYEGSAVNLPLMPLHFLWIHN